MAVVDARVRSSRTIAALLAGALLGACAVLLTTREAPAPVRSDVATLDQETPDVIDMPMERAIDTLVDAGFRVMAVGRGRIKIHELGVRGHIVRVQGWHGTELRYCTARLPDCVAVPSR